MTKPVINCQHVSKTYLDGHFSTDVLSNINLTIERGQRIAIVGSSGSGKSTLLHLLGGLDQQTSGDITLMGLSVRDLSDKQLSQLRNRHIGFVYQFHHLLAEFSALDNVAIPLIIGGTSAKVAKQRAKAILSEVGLNHRLTHKPGELSGGERQRAAIARALITQPDILLADEPTGNLDQRTAATIFDLLIQLNASTGAAIVVVTHDQQLAAKMQHQFVISDGHLTVAS